MTSILAVDDNEVHCYAIQKLLQTRGFDVRTANFGRGALEAAKASRPDVILLDVNLPDIDGFKVCSDLRENESTREIPVVFHTATSANEVNRTRALMVGGDAFLTYPISPEQLVSVIEGCMAKHKRPRTH